MKTQKEIELEKLQISIEYLVKVRKQERYNGYLGIVLVKPTGKRKESQITDMWVEDNSVVILTDTYRFKKPLKTIQSQIEILY